MRLVRERGLRAEDVDMVVGASGGPKWFALAGLDRYLFGVLAGAPRKRPMHLIGSSVGSWRMACLAQNDAVAALHRAHQAYLEQSYSARPTPQEVSTTVAAMLDTLFGKSGEKEILAHPWARLHILTTEFRGLLASERRALLAAGLVLAAGGNLLTRRSLRLQMRRVVVHHAAEPSPLRFLSDFPTQLLPLTAANLRPALLASGSLPLLMPAVRLPGGNGRACMDGGFIDYHPAFDFGAGEGLVLYPNYFPYIVPGWFDKTLPWRRSRSEHLARVLLLAPSPEFVARLPHGKIPDRDDFARLDQGSRLHYWRQVVAESERLADELQELQATHQLADRLKPL